MTRTNLIYIMNTIPGDDLAILVVKASAAVIWSIMRQYSELCIRRVNVFVEGSGNK